MGEDMGEDMGEAVDMDEGMGVAGDMDIVDAVWWAEQQQRLRFYQSPMEEDADRDYSWRCSNCTYQNAAAAFPTFSFWGRARMYVIFLVWYVPVGSSNPPSLVVPAK